LPKVKWHSIPKQAKIEHSLNWNIMRRRSSPQSSNSQSSCKIHRERRSQINHRYRSDAPTISLNLLVNYLVTSMIWLYMRCWVSIILMLGLPCQNFEATHSGNILIINFFMILQKNWTDRVNMLSKRKLMEVISCESVIMVVVFVNIKCFGLYSF